MYDFHFYFYFQFQFINYYYREKKNYKLFCFNDVNKFDKVVLTLNIIFRIKMNILLNICVLLVIRNSIDYIEID